MFSLTDGAGNKLFGAKMLDLISLRGDEALLISDIPFSSAIWLDFLHGIDAWVLTACPDGEGLGMTCSHSVRARENLHPVLVPDVKLWYTKSMVV